MRKNASLALTFCTAIFLVAACEDKAERQRQEQAAAQFRAAEAERIQQQKREELARREQSIADIEALADVAEKQRQESVKQHFPEKTNAIAGCIDRKGGAHVRADFRFGSEPNMAYKIELGEPLAQRFIAYIERASLCTAFGSSSMERALIPALPHPQNSRQLVTLIAAVADLTAMAGDNSSRNFAVKVQMLANLFE